MLSRRSSIAVCIGLFGVAILAQGGAVALDTDPVDRAMPRSSAVAAAGAGNDTASATLNRSIVSVRGGEAATLTVELRGTDEATIVVGGDGAGDNVTATVTDGNGDGAVPLVFETEAIGTMATRLYPVDDGDDYGTVNASGFGGPLPAGEYPVSVYVGHGVSGEPTDVGTLVVNETTTPEPTTDSSEDTTPAPTTELPDAFIDHSGDAVTMRPDEGQTIEGTTSLDPDRSVTVRLRSSGDRPFLKSEEVFVGEDGGFSATFDLSGVEAPASGTAVVTVDGDLVAGPVDVEVVEAQETTVEETASPGQSGFGVGGAVVALAFALFGRRRLRS